MEHFLLEILKMLLVDILCQINSIYHFHLGPYSLSVRDVDEQRGAHVKHYKIRSPDPKIGYFIAARRVFKTLEELIDHYISEILFLF